MERRGEYMKKVLLLFLLSIMGLQPIFASELTTADDILNRVKTNRQEVYSKLDLDIEQKGKIKEIDNKVYQELNPKLEEIAVFIKKIDDIANSDNCTVKAVNEVKKEFKHVDKEITVIRNSYEKEFKQVLTKNQKTLYKKARKEQRAKIRKEIKELKLKQRNEKA